ncbi:MAG: HD domain-containing protein [Phycisphaerae bacterium]|nr:HD domain-containing protein [Phycisphaerae bacterium]
MIDNRANQAGVLPHDQFRGRCTRLGLPVWFVGDGGVVVAPAPSGPEWAFLRARPLIEQVRKATVEWSAMPVPEVRQIAPGLWLVPVMGHAAGRERLAAIAAAVGPGLFPSTFFAGCCRDIGIDPSDVGTRLSGWAHHSDSSVSGLAKILTWMLDDLVRGAVGEESIDCFTVQLTELYEEIGFVFRLGRTMNQLAEPDGFMENVCRELRETLSFGWIAAAFLGSDNHEASFDGHMILSGSVPCPLPQFHQVLRSLLPTLDPERFVLIEGDEPSGLARLVDSTVVVQPIRRKGQLIGALLAGNKIGRDPDPSSVDTQMLDAAAVFVGIFLENASLYADQRSLFLGTLGALTASIDAKDRYTCGHSERVAHLAKRLALTTGMDEGQAERIRISGIVHDVGKIGVPEAVLCKQGRLTDDEFAAIKLHPSIGYRILKDIPQMSDIVPGVLYHHERWDGRGYPEGLQGQRIPLVARILALADSFDAMSSNRSYRAAMPRERVLAEIRRCAGTQFDPDLTPAFVSLDFTEFDGLVSRHQAIEARAA